MERGLRYRQRVWAAGALKRVCAHGQPLASLCPSPTNPGPGGKGPQALVFLAGDERIWEEGLVLEGWGWTWEQAVCLSQHWVPA